MEMDEEKISMVLVRASELRSKIAICIHNNQLNEQEENQQEEDEETLLTICDALDSLESLLNSLQTLQQQQQYEREAVIGDIENSRKMLLKKLGDYKGEHIDVIREAEIFAGMKVEHDNDLLLPPYPARTPQSLVFDNNNFSRFTYARKLAQNGYNGGDLKNEPENGQTQSSPNKLWGGLRFVVQTTAKTMLTLVGVISLLNLAGFEPRISKKGSNLNVLTMFQQPDTTKKKLTQQCPPGKIAIMEGGEIHCIVKERVEIPFDSIAENPNVSYGCG